MKAMVRRLLDYFFTKEEQANFSLSGRPCRSTPNIPAKDALPAKFLQAITSKQFLVVNSLDANFYISILDFTIVRWERWYKINLSVNVVHSAVSVALTNSHTSVKRQKKKNSVLISNVREDDLSTSGSSGSLA